MTNRVKQFNFKGQTIHVMTINGEPCFVAREVAKVLGYPWPANAVRDYVNNEDKANYTLHLENKGGTPSGPSLTSQG